VNEYALKSVKFDIFDAVMRDLFNSQQQ